MTRRLHISARVALVASLALIVTLALAWGSAPAQAAAITVNTTDDEVNSDGDCSLREAIQAANIDAATDACAAGSGADTITVPFGTYDLTLGVLDVFDAATINGAGAGSTIVDGGAADAVFSVLSEGDIDVTISALAVQNGDSLDNGGGIYNGENLTLTDVVVTGNTAPSGGGVYNSWSGTVTLTNSSVTGNTAEFDGGGILNEGPDTLNLVNSAVSGNSAGEDGGGIANHYDASANIEGTVISGNTAAAHGGGVYNDLCCDALVTITDSTISGNQADDGGGIFHGDNTLPRAAGVSAVVIVPAAGLSITNSTISGNQAFNGGGILNVGVIELTNVTIADNTASSAPAVSAVVALGGGLGGGVFNPDGAVSMVNTIVADNTPDDCLVAPVSNGHNLDSDDSCALTATGDQQGVDPLLAALALNGPPSRETHALPADSPAVDAGDDASCPDADQRGVARPQDGDEGGAGSAVCDIGAYELVPDADNDGILDAFDACVNVPEDLDGVQDTDGCPEADVIATPTPSQLPPTGGGPEAGAGVPWLALLVAGAALAGAGGALAAVRRRR